MNVEEYIASGILELYVAGVLSEEENRDVHAMILKHPEVREEIEQIEKAIVRHTAALAPGTVPSFEFIKTHTAGKQVPVRSLQSKKTYSWITYTGWAATIVLASGMFFMYYRINNLQQDIKRAGDQNIQLEQQISDVRKDAEATEELIEILRQKDIVTITLGGQAIAPESFARVFWNKKDEIAYVDVSGLPEPPEGKVYQVWSLKLDPLTPTSMGILDQYDSDNNKIFALANPNQSQAFGITLEPEGGSATPTMDQLYALGVVSAS
ncbi:anti-sigma factor [Robertkochia solimangrovi]|uniref:anti-sigma factor n=1 Tax=Robertkochia solimangrovi TaxID=2213046 RepID=UPI0011808A9D|nr:anti-sigma factor [Robertkochia solimangrovi]TRZ45064.1 anti-sigma factor [Robertkochia solimangrovi]